MGAYRLAKSTLPIEIANDSKNHFLEGFRNKGGQTDASKGGWPKRMKRLGKGRVSKTETEPSNLIKTGKYRKSIKIVSATFTKIEIASIGIPYAQAHNEGLGNMPQREVLGLSKELDSKNRKTIVKKINKVFK